MTAKKDAFVMFYSRLSDQLPFYALTEFYCFCLFVLFFNVVVAISGWLAVQSCLRVIFVVCIKKFHLYCARCGSVVLLCSLSPPPYFCTHHHPVSLSCFIPYWQLLYVYVFTMRRIVYVCIHLLLACIVLSIRLINFGGGFLARIQVRSLRYVCMRTRLFL